MKHDWEYKTLGEVASYINGYAFKPEQWTSDGVPIIRIQNLNNQDAPYNYFDGEVPEKVKVKDGDLLISWSASLGAYIWSGGNAFLNQHIFKVSFDKSDINKFYLKYAVSSKLEAMGGLVHGATMKHIVKKDFDNTRIPYPPLAIQEQIVAELDKVSEIIEKKKQQVKELDNLAQSIFYDMFGDPVENEKGWEKQMIGELCEDKKSIIRANKTFCQTDIIRYIDISSIDNKANVVVSMTQFVYKDAPSRAQQVVNYGDILVSLVRPNLKNIATVNDLGEDLVASSGFCVLRTKMCAQFFLKGVLLSDRFTKYLTDRVSGANYPAIREEDIKCCSISVPPLPLQQSFAKKIEAIEKQKELINASIKEMQTLFDSRMEYYFG